MSGVVNYYVWYRVTGDTTAAHAAVSEVLHDVFRHAGVTGHMLVRRDDPRTWMEVYEHVGDTTLFERELAAAVARHRVARFVEGGKRHVEPFVKPV
jgi:hypothetical protein